MALSFTVKIGSWEAGGYGPYVDTVTVDDPSPELVRLVAHAHSAGVVDVTDGLDVNHIQTQEDAERAYTAAQGDWVAPTWGADGYASPGRWSGGWQVGNEAQHELDEARKQVAQASDEGELEAAEANLVAVDKAIQKRLKKEGAA